MQTLTLIDTFGFFFRSFYALKRQNLQTKDGFPTGLLKGFCDLIMQLHKDSECNYIAFALEGSGSNKRKEILPSYKQNRSALPKELALQLPIAIEWISKMGFVNLSLDGYEADDMIASANSIANKQGVAVRIISHDKDLYQLIDKDTFIYEPSKKQIIKEQECFEKYGIYPKNFIDYQALVGDSSDNVSGIKGIGAKSAQILINHFGSIESMYERENELDSLLTPRLANIVREGKESAFLSKKLVSLHKDLPLKLDLQQCAMPQNNPLLKIKDELKKYELNKIISKISTKSNQVSIDEEIKSIFDDNKDSEFSFTPHLLDEFSKLEKVLDSIPQDALVAFDCECDSLDTKVANFVGFSFCFDGENAYYVPVLHSYLGVEKQLSKNEAKLALQKLFSYKLLGHNIKFDLSLIKHFFGLESSLEVYDSMVLAWIYDTQDLLSLDKQMLKWFKYKMISFDLLVGKGKCENFSQVPISVAYKYGAEDCAASFALYHKLLAELESKWIDILEVAKSLEFPFIKVLVDMESNGICIDTKILESMQTKAIQNINELSVEIFRLLGEEFNLNSTQQLADVLFNKLGLRSGRSVKGGLSTDEKTLLSIKDSHPVIALLLEYREINKLKNTYIEPLLNFAKNDKLHRVYTSFLQTGTATGRLSSKSPNLQNIPVRREEGRKIREAFVAQEGYDLISIDYSQIELRLLAHFCQDKSLVEAFLQDKDIHYEMSLRLFGESQAKQKRHIAKSINFGLIYGMGSKKLSQTLQIPLSQAKEYIETYFMLFPTIKNYLHEQQELLQQRGFIQTLLGRRRYFDFESASEFNKINYLREGINAIFQGSAADLIKLSMLKIYNFYKNSELKMLLQVHDELIFEAPSAKASEFAKNIADIMNNIYKLNVPLKCGVGIGKTWAQLK